MSYCPKCGNKVEENMTFCPKCGGSLKVTAPFQAAPQPYQRTEKNEKQEKNEPEKREKQEKGEFSHIGWFIGGIIIIIIGILAFARASGYIVQPIEGALILLAIGIVVIAVAVWLALTARKRTPRPV